MLQNCLIFGGLSIGTSISLIIIEHLILSKFFPFLYVISTNVNCVPKAYSLVIISLLLTVFTLIYLAMKVRLARNYFQEKVKKEGGNDTIENFSLPKLYAEGNSENTIKFNSIQRGHQHALESYTPFIMLMIFGGVVNPISVTIAGISWCIGRILFAHYYSINLTTPW